MAIYEVTITTLPILLATLAIGPLRVFGLLPHRTARRYRRADPRTDLAALRLMAVTFVVAVVALTFEVDLLGVRVVVAAGLLLAGVLVAVAVWRFTKATYQDGLDDADPGRA